jgi:hypothetical protein
MTAEPHAPDTGAGRHTGMHDTRSKAVSAGLAIGPFITPSRS